MTAAQEKLPVPEPVLREDRLAFTPTARSVSFSRRRTARLVREWGHPELAGDAALLVSELATNALLHGAIRGRLFRVHLTLTAIALRIAVSDPRGERLPVPREAEADECYGRGLMIVARLADRWGVEPRTVGKTVFAELALKQGPDAPVGPREHRAGPPHTRIAEGTRTAQTSTPR
ncbi:ATP-binding protein [Streptomyces sp. NPDC088251]|uniref:ATP-binding protein n=1 Tax=unclassified Streptomyces TaxID=2593676 RepID=UPI0037FDABE5